MKSPAFALPSGLPRLSLRRPSNRTVILIGLAAATPAGASAMLFYLAVYVVMSLGSFVGVLMLRNGDGENLETFDDIEIDPSSMPVGFVNSKGFGGNNATGFFVSPSKTEELLKKRWGTKDLTAHKKRSEKTQEAAENYNLKADDQDNKPIYQFGEGVVDGEELSISPKEIVIPGFRESVSLDIDNPYGDLSDA